MIGTCGLDNQMLLYDIRLSKPVYKKIMNNPSPNCLKIYENKLLLAPLDHSVFVEVLRKQDLDYQANPITQALNHQGNIFIGGKNRDAFLKIKTCLLILFSVSSTRRKQCIVEHH